MVTKGDIVMKYLTAIFVLVGSLFVGAGPAGATDVVPPCLSVVPESPPPIVFPVPPAPELPRVCDVTAEVQVAVETTVSAVSVVTDDIVSQLKYLLCL